MTEHLPLLRRSKGTADAPAFTLKRTAIHKGLLAVAALTLAVVMLFAMTAAWYKNVVQTSGLLFHVDQWGLDSSVNVTDELIGAAPGDSGRIDLSVDNTSDGIISVSLAVSKGDMYNALADMRKRVFFYIDDMVYRGGEHTPRVYLNSVEAYSYTVLPAQNLVLGENGNAAPLMWEWVFDVLGFYFYGTVTPTTEAEIAEYLRPVEYRLDQATFRDGELETVDGTTTPAAFLEQLSDRDGYEGTVTTSVTSDDGRVYYPVTVNEDGEGVWIYLCDLGEIEYETVVDTTLGSAEADTDRQFETCLHVTAQQRQLEVIEVATEAQLSDALNDNLHDMVQLTGNVALSSSLKVGGIHEKILDLNGHSLSAQANAVVEVEEGSSLTMLNGTLQGSGTSSAYGLTVTGGDVALSNVTITDTAQAVRIWDPNASYNDSRVTLTGCTIRCSSIGVHMRGNGSKTVADTVLIIDDCLIDSDGYYALTGSGNTDTSGTDIHVRNSTLRSVNGSAIYHPQRDSTLLVENSLLESFTAVTIKGGTATFVDTRIHGVACEGLTPAEPGFAGSGYVDTGAGVYVETGYNYPSTVTITGDSEVTSVNADAVLFYDSTNPLYTITVTGGKYSSDVSAFLADGYRCVKDGNYWVVEAE